MKNKIKVMFSFLTFFLIILNFSTIYSKNISASLRVEKPTSDFYVLDKADILSENTKKEIIEKNKYLFNKYGAQIVVVTLPSLNGENLEEYANTLFNEWKIGDSDKNNGILILLAMDKHQFRMEVGTGLGEFLPDGKAGRIRDNYFFPSFKENKYDEGILNGFNKLSELIENYYEGKETDLGEDDGFGIMIFIFAFMILVLAITYSHGNGSFGGFYGGISGSSHSSGGSSFGGGGGSIGGGCSGSW